MNLRLKVVGGELERSEVDLALPATLGRGGEASLRLVHPLVSRLHCELFSRGDQVWVRDLRSLNGTFVGSERIEECPLRPGDLLTVGVVTFRASYRPEERPAASLESPGGAGTAAAAGASAEPPSAGRPESHAGAGSGSGSTDEAASRRVLRQATLGSSLKPVGDTEPLPADLAPPPASSDGERPGALLSAASETPAASDSPGNRSPEVADERG